MRLETSKVKIGSEEVKKTQRRSGMQIKGLRRHHQKDCEGEIVSIRFDDEIKKEQSYLQKRRNALQF